MMKTETVKVKWQKKIGPNFYLLNLSVNNDFLDARPGQFVMLSFPDRIDPLLPRPMCIYSIIESECEYEEVILRIGYEVVGKGTTLMSKLKPGDELRCTGQLGNGWDLESIGNSDNIILVAGGISITSFFMAAEEILLIRKKPVKLLYGASTAKKLVLTEDFKQIGVDIITYTEDGTRGRKGMVSTNLDKFLNKNTAVLACGPNRMLEAVYRICKKNGINPQLSFDARMACGFGVCLGCNIKIRDKKDGKVRQVRVCKEGPVFMGDEVVW